MLVDDRSSYKRQKYTEVDSENEMPMLIIKDVPVPPSSQPALPALPELHSSSLLSSTVTTRSQASTTPKPTVPKPAVPKPAVLPDVRIEDVNPPPEDNSEDSALIEVEEIVSLPDSPGDHPDCVTSPAVTGTTVSMDVPSTNHVTVSNTTVARPPRRVTAMPNAPASTNALPDCAPPHIDTDGATITAEDGGSLESMDDDKSSSEGDKDGDYAVDSADYISSDDEDSSSSLQESTDDYISSSDEDDSSRNRTPIKLNKELLTKKDKKKVMTIMYSMLDHVIPLL